MTTIRELVQRAMISTAKAADWPCFGRLWRRAWRATSDRFDGIVRIRVHGHIIEAPFAYPYPIFARRWPLYNAPLVAVVAAASQALARRVVVIDIGAAIGDTALLVLENCRALVDRVVCIDGDEAFVSLLRRNLRDEPVTVHNAVLSNAPGEVASLVRMHRGTASAIGASTVVATTLDDLLGRSRIDVLKIDVDGFDGRILDGAHQLLRASRPLVLFEWHPRLYERAGNDWQQPFAVLSAADYSIVLWYSKYGDHLAATATNDTATVERRAAECFERSVEDWHYDVVALPSGLSYLADGIASLEQARYRRSRW